LNICPGGKEISEMLNGIPEFPEWVGDVTVDWSSGSMFPGRINMPCSNSQRSYDMIGTTRRMKENSRLF